MPSVAGLSATLTCARVWPGIILFFIYTGVEVAAGQWTYSLLTEARSVSAPMAGAAVSAYWGSFTVARVLAAALVPRIGPRVVLRAALMSAPVGGALLWLADGPALHVLALIVLGASLASVYPLVMAETARRVGDRYALHAVGLQVSAAYLGAGGNPGRHRRARGNIRTRCHRARPGGTGGDRSWCPSFHSGQQVFCARRASARRAHLTLACLRQPLGPCS